MSETKTITVEVFRDPDGKPTCSSDHKTGKCCGLMLTRKYGSIDFCGWTGEDIEREGGFTRPHSLCPIWKDAS